MSGRKWLLLLLTVLAMAGPFPQASAGEVWLLQNGTEYYGDALSYSFESKELTIRKADGKSFTFPARELAYGGKLRLIDSPAFRDALKEYRPPLLPLLALGLTVLAAMALPTLAGLWGGAHVLGTTATIREHLLGFVKLVIVVAVGLGSWLAGSILLDPERPILPDKNIDLVLISAVLVTGVLTSAIVISHHYGRSFWKGLAITLLAGVFAAIVSASMGLAGLFLATRLDSETVLSRVIFEPFGWF